MKKRPVKKRVSKLLKLPYEKYEKQGVDIGLLLSNLKRTPTERLENNYQMMLFIEECRKSREKLLQS